MKFKIFVDMLNPNDGRNFKAKDLAVVNQQEAEDYHNQFLKRVPDMRLFAFETEFLRELARKPNNMPEGNWKGYIDTDNNDTTLPYRPFFLGEPFTHTWLEPAADDERLFKIKMPTNLNRPEETIMAEVFGVSVLPHWINYEDGSPSHGAYAVCLYAVEKDPEGRLRHAVNFAIIDEHNYQGSQLHCWLFHLFKFQAKSQWGEKKIRERVRVGAGKDRRLVKIKKIVHVRPKKPRRKSEPGESKDIMWSHSWESRAHWRNLPRPDGIGKGPDGEYNIKGMTWVVSSIKGQGDVVKKIRVVRANPQSPQPSQPE